MTGANILDFRVFESKSGFARFNVKLFGIGIMVLECSLCIGSGSRYIYLDFKIKISRFGIGFEEFEILLLGFEFHHCGYLEFLKWIESDFRSDFESRIIIPFLSIAAVMSSLNLFVIAKP